MSSFRDVNREQYLKALLRDASKQAHLNEIPDNSKTILEFIIRNPTNGDSKKKSLKINDHKMIVVRGSIRDAIA